MLDTVEMLDTGARPHEATVHVTTGPRGQEVAVVGHLDARTLADVRLALQAALASGAGDLHLHLGDAVLGDATAVGLLLETHRRARRTGRRLVLGELTPRSERLLRTARLLPARRREVHHAPVEGVAALTA